jgi:hypothetical protein
MELEILLQITSVPRIRDLSALALHMVRFFFSLFSSLPSQAYFFFPVFFSFFFCSMSTSISAGAPVNDGSGERAEDYDELDEDDDDDMDDDISLLRPPSVVTSVSTRSLGMPPPSSEISRPSGLPAVTIARLTHDELTLNPEFTQYIRTVDALHELLNYRSAVSTGESPLPLWIPFSPLFSQRQLWSRCLPRLALSS